MTWLCRSLRIRECFSWNRAYFLSLSPEIRDWKRDLLKSSSFLVLLVVLLLYLFAASLGAFISLWNLVAYVRFYGCRAESVRELVPSLCAHMFFVTEMEDKVKHVHGDYSCHNVQCLHEAFHSCQAPKTSSCCWSFQVMTIPRTLMAEYPHLCRADCHASATLSLSLSASIDP